MTSRRRTLATARALPSSSPSGVNAALETKIQNAIDQLASLSAALAQARTGLVQELVEVCILQLLTSYMFVEEV
jgi:hypothetical protein